MLIPELLDLFEDQNTMPPSLKGWLYVLDCMPFIIGFGIAMASGIWAIHHIFGAHKVFLYLKKRLGLWGLVTDIHVCRFLETMGLMLQAGIPLKHAFLHTQKILPNKGLNTHMKAIETTLDKGHSLSYGLGQIEWFDPMTIRLIKMGEKSGDIVPSIQQSAQLLYGRIIRRMDRITRLLQPLLLVMIALLLLWMISIFITPLYTQFLGDHHVG
ncbi:MAG: type II secretion system F family protein, partial [Alphaproteobacteria bacterium]|nr:type II secretion system F family protein [Alphaproteobacteria bacterium]